jgi:hypothetical protein
MLFDTVLMRVHSIVFATYLKQRQHLFVVPHQATISAAPRMKGHVGENKAPLAVSSRST